MKTIKGILAAPFIFGGLTSTIGGAWVKILAAPLALYYTFFVDIHVDSYDALTTGIMCGLNFAILFGAGIVLMILGNMLSTAGKAILAMGE